MAFRIGRPASVTLIRPPSSDTPTITFGAQKAARDRVRAVSQDQALRQAGGPYEPLFEHLVIGEDSPGRLARSRLT